MSILCSTLQLSQETADRILVNLLWQDEDIPEGLHAGRSLEQSHAGSLGFL